MTSLYVRPIVRLGAAPTGTETGSTFEIGGCRCLNFTEAEVITREGHNVERHLLRGSELADGRLDGLGSVLNRIGQPREPIAGLNLNRPHIMGIINVTPDSFSDGGIYLAPQAAIAHALRLQDEGADILDIGGESTRPGSDPIPVEEEWRRVSPVITALAGRTTARLSIDTRKAEVMRRAADSGVHIINDVASLTHDADSLSVAARTGLPIVLMHAQGEPRTMQAYPHYADVVLDVYDALGARIEACRRAGIVASRLVVDPGIGFGKTLAHNLALLRSLSVLHGLGCAIMLGASRKSFITRLTGADDTDRVPGSVAAALIGAAQGAQLLRVHDVAATRQAVQLWHATFAEAMGS